MKGKERKRLIVAIDGPSGAGKSTIGKFLARRLGYTYIDTGAMYRVVALKSKEDLIDKEDGVALGRWISSIQIVLTAEGELTRVFCNGEELTESIRSPEISLLASAISKKRVVREALVRMQREMGKEGGVVLEGRDIGTVVFPDAEVKFYLDADKEERARRRFVELNEKGVKVDFKETLDEVIQRDHNDMYRDHSPLKKAEDAVLIDSTHHSIEEVVEEMARLVEKKVSR
jgi:cytidylate kinase